MGFSTFPKKRMASVALLISSSRKDLLKRMIVCEGPSFDRTMSLVAVAAAASVPSSLTSSTALWAACQGKNKHQRSPEGHLYLTELWGCAWNGDAPHLEGLKAYIHQMPGIRFAAAIDTGQLAFKRGVEWLQIHTGKT